MDKGRRQPTFYICYGFLGGHSHGLRLRWLLRRAGYKQSHDAETADVIIAHSAGCFEIPSEAKPKLILFIGMPLNENSSWRVFLKAQRANARSLVGHFHWLTALEIFIGSIFYGLTEPHRNIRIVKTIKQVTTLEFNQAQVVFIVNHYDPWPQSDQLTQYVKATDWAYISLDGSHDNIWENPKTYVSIINYYAERLLAETDHRQTAV